MDYKGQLEVFLGKKLDKKKLIVIYGPTGAGKTAMGIEIAKMLETEIISTDSRQIYRGMDIGTGKITEEEKQGIAHHMIDIISPDEEYSVWAFKKKSEEIIQDLHNRWKIPMLVGWTGLYIDSLIFDMNLWKAPHDEKLRKDFSTMDTQELYRWLQDIDSEYAEEIHPNNRPYIERWIEVMILTGKSKREFREEKKLKYDVLFITPFQGDREELYERINTRVWLMFESGLENEVRALIREWYIEENEWMKTIGYQEFFPYFRWKALKEECIEMIKQHSRNYAKRQINWFSKYEKYRDR